MQQLISEINTFCNIYLISISIIVQFVVYPSFKNYNTNQFKSFHSDYTTKMLYIVGPVMTAELLCCVYLLYVDLPSVLFSSLLLSIVWVLTFARIVPIHNRLNNNFELNEHKKLLRLNGLRTLAWILKFTVIV